jgi:hypothetical protein
MEAQEFFKIVPAKRFFTKYCTQVTNWTHKSRGYDGNKRPIEFSPEDIKAMKIAAKKVAKDIANVDFDKLIKPKPVGQKPAKWKRSKESIPAEEPKVPLVRPKAEYSNKKHF